MLHIGVDIGGTFTDFVISNGGMSYASLHSFKVPSTPPRFASGVKQGLRMLIDRGILDRDTQCLITHGTTVSTNAIIERSGPPIGLLTTSGFKDVLHLARFRLDNPVNLFGARPASLISRDMVFEVRERTLASGAIDMPLVRDDVVAACEAALARGVRQLAVCLMHSYRNAEHELLARRILSDFIDPDAIILSHEVWPQPSEYERASAAVLNAYAREAMADYLAEIEAFLSNQLPKCRLLITKSNGGTMGTNEGRRMPIHTVLSGPAAGVTGASHLGNALRSPNLLTMDMGGTSTDISTVVDGRPVFSMDGKVGDFPLMMPVTAIEAIGAGGGSIAWLDGTMLKVGPQSAGAVPGPACYDRGGTLPTLSDAYLLCGFLDEGTPLASNLRLRRDLATKAMQPVVEALRGDLVNAAESCIAVATANMLAKILPFIAKLGLEPKELTLMLFGGAGAIHGPLLADELGIGKIIIPKFSSVFCAFGCLVSDVLGDFVQTIHGTDITSDTVAAGFRDLSQRGALWLDEQGLDVTRSHEYGVDARYAGQSFSINVQIPDDAALSGDIGCIEDAFHREHERLFTHSDQEARVEILSLYVRSRGIIGSSSGLAAAAKEGAAPVVAVKSRPVRFNSAWHDTPVIDRESLAASWSRQGPLVIEHETSTVVVPPAFRASADSFDNLILERAE